MTSLVGAEFWRLPVQMQQRAQWCLAGPDKAPYLAGSNGLYHASPVEGPWHDFDTACSLAVKYSCGIGFVLTAEDPFSCIDLDVKDAESFDSQGKQYPPEKRTPKQELAFYSGIVQFAQSYTELSASRKGLHIWVLGNIGAGRRGKGVEVYSQQRFIICTGVPVSEVDYHILNGVAIPRILQARPLPVVDGELILNNLIQQFGTSGSTIELVEVGEELTDGEIWKRAASASNAKKFKDLCEGNFQQYHFPSQSEADLALMSMLTFYSKSNAQCRRMFRQTALGARSKAIKNNVYLDRTLQIIRGRQEREAAIQAHGESLAATLLATTRTEAGKISPKILEIVRNLDQSVHSSNKPNELTYVPPEVEGLEWPPGLVGAIAGFIYQSSPRPVKEVSIVAALGLMAGITGKAYNVGQTGINLYIILIARSAIGKEAMHSGIGHIMRSKCGHVLTPFVNFTDYASGPALTKAMNSNSSFVNVSGEWGRKLQRMSEDRKDGPMQQLRTVMTHLYQKSGAASVMGGLSYSNKDQNVGSVNAVAYSMIGETTPGTFYDSLTQSMMEDGFLSRFNIIEYLGERPAENKHQVMQVPDEISNVLANIASHAISIVHSPHGNAIQIKMEPEAERMLEEFNGHSDSKIREAGADESLRQIWNRAHLKAIRVAGVLAASDNHVNPLMTSAHVRWAIDLVINDAQAMLRKVADGDIGIDDTSRFRKLQNILKKYLQGNVPASYGLSDAMVTAGIVPRKYLQGRTSQVRCFQNYRLGATLALDHTIKTAIDSGYIVEMSKDKAIELYGYHGRCFRVVDTGH